MEMERISVSDFLEKEYQEHKIFTLDSHNACILNIAICSIQNEYTAICLKSGLEQ